MEETNLEGSLKESEDKLEAKSDEWFSSKNISLSPLSALTEIPCLPASMTNFFSASAF